MAERRMFAKKITESDAFLDMPASTQALYFHLNMSADDDGFVNNPRKIQRMVGAGEDDFKLLIAKSFIITFESGVIVIKHWRMHNYVRNDRYKPTDYIDEKAQLSVKLNNAYTLGIPNGNQLDTVGIPVVSVGKVREGKVSLGKDNKKSIGQKRSVFTPPTLEQVKEYCAERKNNVDAERFIDFYACKGWMVGKNKMKDWKAAVRNWERGESNGRTGTSSKPKESDNSQYNGMVL